MRLSWLCVSVAMVGCFNPGDPPGETDNPGDSSEGSDASDVDDSTDEQADGSTNDDSSNANCGNGEVEGDEVCDDGVNDGSYGGCVAGCGAFGPRCGDRTVDEGNELCDDGVNDGSYGGCAEDCSALAGFCGDGDINGPEGCDRGDDNHNGSGCNVDCVVSGSVVAEFDIEDTVFCDGAFFTNPVFRDNGNALLAVTGYCPADTQLLLELSPQGEVVQMLDDVLLPSIPVNWAAVIADQWLLSAGQCNYVIDDRGNLTEVCEPNRTAGYSGLLGYPNGSYVALNEIVARYDEGSPSLGDVPVWTYTAPSDENVNYGLSALARGPSNSLLVAGYLQYVSDGTSYGYIARLTAAGNTAGTTTTATFPRFDGLAVSPDGWMVGSILYDPFRLLRLDENFQEAWTLDVPTLSLFEFAIDSVGDIVILYVSSDEQRFIVSKRAPDGTTERWAQEVEAAPYSFKLAIDATDNIWVASVPTFEGGTLLVRKLAP